eukprot:757112-Hanusia_phi.AAC.3
MDGEKRRKGKEDNQRFVSTWGATLEREGRLEVVWTVHHNTATKQLQPGAGTGGNVTTNGASRDTRMNEACLSCSPAGSL